MTLPPNPIRPGDRLRVTADLPHGTELRTGDLVTAVAIGYTDEFGAPTPIVQVSTAYGLQVLTVAVVAPWTEDAGYAPANPDNNVDASLTAMLSADPDLLTWATSVTEQLSDNDGGFPFPLDSVGMVSSMADDDDEEVPEQVGDHYVFRDGGGDSLAVVYVEKTCNSHGREGAFVLYMNEDAETNVVMPAENIDNLIAYLTSRRAYLNRNTDTDKD